MAGKPRTIDECLAALSGDKRAALRRRRHGGGAHPHRIVNGSISSVRLPSGS